MAAKKRKTRSKKKKSTANKRKTVKKAVKKKSTKKKTGEKKKMIRKKGKRKLTAGVASSALSAIVGSKNIPRQEAITRIWAYIKRKRLQDKKDGRKFNLDSTLKPLFGNKKQANMFEVAKVVSKNLTVAKKEAVKQKTKASAALATVVGSKNIPRQKAIKRIWDYIKKKGLQDKRDGRKFNLDSTLKPLFGNKKQASMFEVMKIVSKNLS